MQKLLAVKLPVPLPGPLRNRTPASPPEAPSQQLCLHTIMLLLMSEVLFFVAWGFPQVELWQ